MKVLHITRTFHPAFGGMEEMIQNLVRHQRAAGLDATVLTLDRPAGSPLGPFLPEEVVDGIPVRRIAWRGSSRYPLAPAVLRHLGNADLLHVHAVDFFYDFLAWTRPLHHRPMVASTHGAFFHSSFMRPAKQAWFHSVTRLSTAAYDGIIASSISDATLFGQLRPRLLRTITNGVDVRKWAGRGAREPTRHLIYFGRFAAHKRIDALFALLRALRGRDGSWRLTVAGSPADLSAEQVRSQASDLGDAVRLVVRPDALTMAELIGEAGYFACASAYEGFGIAAVEALAAGLVPVLSDIPPFRRLVAGTDDAILFDPADPTGAASRLVAFHEAAAPRWGQLRSRLMQIASQYDWANVASEYTEFYAAAGRPGRASNAPSQISA